EAPAMFTDPQAALHPIGTGPYKFVSGQPGQNAVYQRWDGYRDKAVAKTYVKDMSVDNVGDNNARYNGLRSGSYNAVWLSSPLDAQVPQLGPGYGVVQNTYNTTIGLELNTKGIFADPTLRQAANMAVDRKAISKLIGTDTPKYQVFAKSFLGYDPALNKDP